MARLPELPRPGPGAARTLVPDSLLPTAAHDQQRDIPDDLLLLYVQEDWNPFFLAAESCTGLEEGLKL